MQFTLQASAIAVLMATAFNYVAADCGSTCYNNTGGNGCVPTDYGISICNQFYGGSDSCKFCVINNCGGYYGTVEIANKAFCKAKGWAKRNARDTTPALKNDIDWTYALDKPAASAKS